jgi:uncharacterized membrane protein YqgA involved in biofilm formation
MGTIVNVIAILVGGALGLIFRQRFPERVANTAMQVMGLFTLLVGIKMALPSQELILVLISLALGSMVGEWIDIEGNLEKFGLWLEQRLKMTEGSPAKGFIYASLVYCVGSMAIVGSIADGVKGDHSILYTKSMMDGIISIPFAASMGAGILGSALPVFLYQGALTLLAGQLELFFTTAIIREMTAVGGVIVMGIGINIMGIYKIKVGNFLPALLFIIIAMILKT